MSLCVSPLHALGAQKKLTVTGDSRKELLSQHFCISAAHLNQKTARLSAGFHTRPRTPSHMHTHAPERSSSPTSQLYNYTVHQWPPAGAVYLALLQQNAAFCSVNL